MPKTADITVHVRHEPYDLVWRLLVLSLLVGIRGDQIDGWIGVLLAVAALVLAIAACWLMWKKDR